MFGPVLMRAAQPAPGCYDRAVPFRNPRSSSVRGYVRDAVPVDGEPFAGFRRPGLVVTRGAGRTDLETLLSELDRGDLLIVPSLDHLDFSLRRVFRMLDDLAERDVGFVSLAERLDSRAAHAPAALAMMRALLDAERRLACLARRRPASSCRDGMLERSRRAVAPWIEQVRRDRPALSWDRIVRRVAASHPGVRVPSAALLRRHVRRLVAAGDLPPSVLERVPRSSARGSEAARRAREMSSALPGASLRDIGARLSSEGILPPRAAAWSPQTVKRLLADPL